MLCISVITYFNGPLTSIHRSVPRHFTIRPHASSFPIYNVLLCQMVLLCTYGRIRKLEITAICSHIMCDLKSWKYSMDHFHYVFNCVCVYVFVNSKYLYRFTICYPKFRKLKSSENQTFPPWRMLSLNYAVSCNVLSLKIKHFKIDVKNLPFWNLKISKIQKVSGPKVFG